MFLNKIHDLHKKIRVLLKSYPYEKLTIFEIIILYLIYSTLQLKQHIYQALVYHNGFKSIAAKNHYKLEVLKTILIFQYILCFFLNHQIDDERQLHCPPL